MAELKTKPTDADVLKFVKSSPATRRDDALELLSLMKKATGMKPRMWGAAIVGFGMYHYKSERSSQEGDWPVAGFSPRKQYLVVYTMPGFPKMIQPLLKKLGKHKVSGGSCLYINKLSDVDKPTLVKIVQWGVKEMKKRYPGATFK